MDGWITIGTKLDSKQLEKDLALQRKELEKNAKESEKLTKQKSKAELDLSEYYEQQRLIKETTDDALKYAQTEKEVNNQLSIEKNQLEELNNKYSKQLENLNTINQKIGENATRQEVLKNQIEETNKKLQNSRGWDNIKKSIDGSSNSLTKIIKKVTRYALAVFSVRSAYMAIRSAMSTLSEYDDELSNQIQAIKISLAYVIKPIVEWVVNAVYSILGFVGGVLKTLFGINIFANATANAMEDMSKSMNNTTSGAKELKKELAGFDEINILGSGSAGGVGMSNSLKNLQNSLDYMKRLEESTKSWSDKIRRWLFPTWDELVEDIKSSYNEIINTFSPIVDWVYNNAIEPIISYFKTSWEELRPIWEPFKKAGEDTIQRLKELYEPFRPFVEDKIINPLVNKLSSAKDLMKKILAPFFNWCIDIINTVFGIFGIHLDYIDVDLENTTDNMQENIGDVKSSIDELNDPNNRVNIESSDINNAKWGINDILNELNSLVGRVWRVTLDFIKNPGESIGNWFNNLFSGIFGATGLMMYPNKMPKLATGGIVDVPRTGIPYRGATIGEKGAEAIVPLTDSRQMSILGEAIGRWVTTNINLTNTIDGRVLNNRLEQIKANNSFARNGAK